MPQTRQSLRPQLTLSIMLFAVLDVVGMVCFATGVMWLVRRQSLFIPNFPTHWAEAIGILVAGLLLMLWAAGRILREMISRPVNPVSKGR
ncbi:hypothetical protein [Propionivibrio sp.]|uniref:hypothetical protein n=1 Tax=Propionivibrio sp. TaxID=2212460 RepID=UPI0025E8F950|nr:hypothetical protein [Propionivibrio sp.]MBK7354644.1 hypothetical protein [Propionivibrio sp.]MBK8402013.1 hypothetical protein [Propionivibrio sp.]MBK8743826.1 hypothetical protein [Propionivibrio sp.]MBK8895436.1 hypothetical protein [Propionivibrio sp.]